MRKLWFRRKGVSTMIGGIIVLSIFLTALGAMVYVSQQYDAYQNTVNKMSQKDIDRFSENLQVVYPGISTPSLVSCSGGGGGQCYQYTMTINNLAGIGTQIARIYIGSPSPGFLCSAGFCILDVSSTPTVNRLSSTSNFINPSESSHTVSFWLDSAAQLASGSFSLVTTRGRVFSFQFPIPTNGLSGSLSLGCVSIYFDPVLFTYDSGTVTIPPTGNGGAPPLFGGWMVPGKTNVLYFVRMSNICPAAVKLLDRTEMTMFQYTGTGLGSPSSFFVIAPMDQSYCKYFPPSNGQSVYCVPTNQQGITGKGNTYPQGNSVGYAYNATGNTCNLSSNPCYELPAAPSQGQPSQPVYVLFGADGEAVNTMKSGGIGANPGLQFAVFLAIYWECEATAAGCVAGFEFGVTLPFISFVTTS